MRPVSIRRTWRWKVETRYCKICKGELKPFLEDKFICYVCCESIFSKEDTLAVNNANEVGE